MEKVLYVEKIEYDWDSNTPVGVYLDIEFGKKEIEKLNEPHKEYKNMVFQCMDCQYNEFMNKDKCSRTSMKIDRNGEYCENDLYQSDGYRKIIEYKGIEMDVLE